MAGTKRIRLCVIGASGRMGGTIIREAPLESFEITGAIAAAGESAIGRSLRDLGLSESELLVQSPESLGKILEGSDVCISFTSAQAELANLPAIIPLGRPLILGTTGFNNAETASVLSSLTGRIPAVMTSNFSVGVNMLFAMATSLKNLPSSFDISILEAHHSGKTDAPSGTAKTLANIIGKERRYSKMVHGRSGMSKRAPDEIEVVSLRGGGMPGEHMVFAFGPHETLRLGHEAYSRSAFAEGALLAAKWISVPRQPRVYSMQDVLGFKS